MRKLLHISLIIILFTGINIQGQQIDIEKEIGECFVKTMEITSSNDDSTLFFASRGIELCKNNNDLNGEIYFHGSSVLYFIRHGKYESAHDELNIYDSITKKLDSDNYRQFSYLLHGDIYTMKGMYVNALKNYYSALELFHGDGYDMDTNEIVTNNPSSFKDSYNPRVINIRVLTNIAYIMRAIGSYDKAIEYIQMIRDDIEEHGNKGLEPIMPKVMKELAFSYAVLGDDRAELTFIELRHLLQNHKWEDKDLLLFECYEGLAKIYIRQGRTDMASQLIAQCRTLSYKFGNPQYEARYHNIAGRLYRETGLYDKCIEECKMAYEIDSNAYFTAATATYNIGRAYDIIGDKKMADLYFGKHNRININHSSRNYQEAVADLGELYNSGVKDGQIAELVHSKELSDIVIISFAITLLLLIISAIFIIKVGKRNSQLNAARSVIDGELRERERISRDLHDLLIGDLVAVKSNISKDNKDGESITKMIDTCIGDVRDMAHGIMPPSLKFELQSIFEDLASHYNNVSFHFYGKDVQIDERGKYALFCIASELINNAQRHAKASHIDLQLIETDDVLSICVQDDGCGFDITTTEEGFGLKGIRSRIEPYRGSLTIESEPGEGSEITVTIKELYR